MEDEGGGGGGGAEVTITKLDDYLLNFERIKWSICR